MRVSLTYRNVSGANGVRLSVGHAGEGPPVVLLHGFPENSTSWRHQIPPLVKAGYTVHVPDLRGYGQSDKPASLDAYQLSKLVDDIAAIACSTGHPRIHLVGHDWGGVIAWAFASSHFDLLDRLVILNAPHSTLYGRQLWRSSQLFKSWYVLFFQIPALPERLIAARDYRVLREMFRRTPAQSRPFSETEIEGYVASFRQPGALTAALNYYRANLHSLGTVKSAPLIEAPTLVLWGERDPALSPTLLNDIPTVAPKAQIVRFPDVGHWIQNEAPDAVNTALLDFLSASKAT